MELQIVDYQPAYAPYFDKLNKAWLEEYFTVEPFDKYVLENPEEAILKDGGHIYFAAAGSAIVGTVALRFIADGVFELTKMAVDQTYRGGGAGQLLCQTAIDKARELGVKKLVLYSNRRLANAIHIYRKLGFVEIPVVPGTYERSDIMMEINFDGGIVPLTEAEVQQLRAETSGTANLIHFNNAGASLPPDVVVDTVIDYLREEALNGGYETEYKYRDALAGTYTQIAKLLNADTSEIALVENASTAWGLLFNGIAFNPGDEIITCEMEYVTNLIGLISIQAQGVQVKVIPNDEQGNFNPDALEAAINPRTRLIAITHIASTTGGMMPVTAIGKIARKHGVLYLLDACQSAGQVPLDVQQIGCDMLSVTGRKYLRAPRGTGFLYVRKEVQDSLKLVLIDGSTVEAVSETSFKVRNDASRFELYEKNRALTLGLGKAVEYALNIGVDRIWQRIKYLATLMRRQLNSIEGITVHDRGTEQCGIVTFSVKGMDSAVVKAQLAQKQINVSVGLAKSTLYYMNKHHLNSVVRASVHYYNTEDEVKALCSELAEMVKVTAAQAVG